MKKIGEEATELVMACKDADHGGQSEVLKTKIVSETADLWFHSMVALAHYGLSPQDVIAELDKRVGTAGWKKKGKAQNRELDESKGVPFALKNASLRAQESEQATCKQLHLAKKSN